MTRQTIKIANKRLLGSLAFNKTTENLPFNAIFSVEGKIKDRKNSDLLVPLTGLEPVRYFYRGILSPLRLPVPPQRLANGSIQYSIFFSKMQIVSVFLFSKNTESGMINQKEMVDFVDRKETQKNPAAVCRRHHCLPSRTGWTVPGAGQPCTVKPSGQHDPHL